MNWVFWLLLANGGIFVIEYVYRKGMYGSFIEALPFIGIPLIISQLGLFYGFRSAPSLIVAGIAFTVVNTVLRMGNTLLLGEKLGGYQLLALILMVVASIVAKMK